ncbi:hypothetical protein [Microbispora rosea]
MDERSSPGRQNASEVSAGHAALPPPTARNVQLGRLSGPRSVVDSRSS